MKYRVSVTVSQETQQSLLAHLEFGCKSQSDMLDEAVSLLVAHKNLMGVVNKEDLFQANKLSIQTSVQEYAARIERNIAQILLRKVENLVRSVKAELATELSSDMHFLEGLVTVARALDLESSEGVSVADAGAVNAEIDRIGMDLSATYSNQSDPEPNTVQGILLEGSEF